MNLKDLYDQTPVAEHGNIIVSGNRVLVLDTDGSCKEYVEKGIEDIRLVRTYGPRIDLKALRTEWQSATTIPQQLRVLAKALGLVG